LNVLKNIYTHLFTSSRKAGELQVVFKARYYHFKQLLYANRKALEAMAELEEALRGTQPFGMNLVRSLSTRTTTSVFQIVQSLNELAPGKYQALYERFDTIRNDIQALLQYERPAQRGVLAIPLHQVDKTYADQVGSKMAFLGEIRSRLGFKVPNGFVITTEGYRRFIEYNDLQPEIDRLIQASSIEQPDQLYLLSSSIQHLFSSEARFPEDLAADIMECYRCLEQEEGAGITVAVRSSALDEDQAGMSFAGQYRSELNVSRTNVLDAYKEVISSAYSVPALSYRLNHGIRDENIAMAVGCLRMVDAVSGGVAYSRNPSNIRDDAIIINSAWGLPKSVVDGSTPSDLFIVTRDEPMAICRKEIAIKEQRLISYLKDGIGWGEMTPQERTAPSLRNEQALQVARLAVDLEDAFGLPQDIEWAIGADGSIILLQCRPLTQITVSREEGANLPPDQEPGSILASGGIVASPGAGAGQVFFVEKEADILQFPKGAVLVTAQALPRWASLLNRAAAVVTEQGNVASHLANVAREFRVPALFGVKGALGRLENGQTITLDADGARIYQGRIEEILAGQSAPKNLMNGSPVLESLKGVSRHIIPLHLLDPESSEFKAQNCRTYHDITRFGHEKSVEEMFRFGKDNRFFERTSRQLICDVPLIYWVINLDDGFAENNDGKYIRLEQITSVPMLAFWEGLMAVPWTGPPPVHPRGFMSIFFEATMNPALEPTARSAYGSRNYCLVSRNFCTLQLRFGFHFSTVEALIGERVSDNYIIFQFKGGAANLQRRMFRARLVAEILEEYGFHTKAKEDAAFARLEGYDQSFMESRLKVLGYVSMHTRQLDMAMDNQHSIAEYKANFLHDLREKILRK
jgi:pyruvate,water dikinase